MMDKKSIDIINLSYKILSKTNLKYLKFLGEKITTLKDKYIYDILESLQINSKNYQLVPIKYVGDKVWVCWFQGIENVPFIVSKCINSIVKNIPYKEVVFITEENFSEYVSIPEKIVVKFKEGKISRTHFSDIIRMNLIAQQGGLWIDATVFLTKKIPVTFFESDFFSLHNCDISSLSYVNGLWTSYFFYAKKCNPLVEQCALYLNEYNIKYDEIIDYFLLDYAITQSIRDLDLQSELEKTPVIGNNRWYLSNVLNKPISDKIISRLNEDSIGIYKLTYKKTYKMKSCGRDTLYKYIFIDGEKNDRYSDFKLS